MYAFLVHQKQTNKKPNRTDELRWDIRHLDTDSTELHETKRLRMFNTHTEL